MTKMLELLEKAEVELPSLLENEESWNSLLVDYHPPIVERVWRQWEENRVFLHRIHPCESNEALFHTHSWPSAMRIVSGEYEMAVGFGDGEHKPPIASTIILPAGSAYEMTHPDAWHYVRPLYVPSLSLMTAGKPWNRNSPKSDKPLHSLADNKKLEIINLFRNEYP